MSISAKKINLIFKVIIYFLLFSSCYYTPVCLSANHLKYEIVPEVIIDSFDTKIESINLEAAGNETICFKIAINSKLFLNNKIVLNLKRSETDNFLQPENISMFALENCQGSNELPPDCLIPVKNNTIKLYDKNRQYKIIWFDIHIPPDKSPGDYTSSFTISTTSQNHDYKVPIKLHVHSFKLPDTPTLKVDLNEYGTGFTKLWGAETGTEKAYQIERAFYKFADQHRMVFNPLPYRSQKGLPRPTTAPELEGSGKNIRVKDWSEYDKRYGPIFDGSLFDNNIPIDHQYLPFNPEWPSSFKYFTQDRERYEAEWIKIAEEFIVHFKEKGWNNTVFQIYLNQKPKSNNKIPWNLDEPKGRKDYNALRYYADLTHKAFSNNLKDFQFRIDISHFYCDKHKGDIKKDFRINNGFNILKPVDIWVISKHSMDCLPAQKKALNLKEHNRTVYEYYSGTRMPLIFDPFYKAVEYGYNAWLRKEDGILFWKTVKTGSKPSDGRNFLVYPGNTHKIRGPLASPRIKAIRIGAQDCEYLKLAEKFVDIKPVVKKLINNNFQQYHKTKKQLSQIIEKGVVR